MKTQKILKSVFAATFYLLIIITGCKKDEPSDPTVKVTGVTLSKTSISMVEGGTETLSATIAPSDATNQKVTWESDKTDIVTVDSNGKVTAVKAGTANITVTTEDGAKTAACTVTVTTKAVSVTGVTLNKSELNITEGESETLTASVSPTDATNQKVTWSSDKTDIATVDSNGKVTAVKAGTANITITTDDGNKTATCKVTVEASNVPVTGISLSHTTLQLAVGNSQTLTATIMPANATNNNIIWESSKTSVATVDANGKVSAIAKGNSQIIVTTEDGSHRAICNVTVVEPISQFEKDGIYYMADAPGSTNVLVTNKKFGVPLTDFENSYSGDVIIPAIVECYGVEYTVTEIGTSAFRGSVNLKSVTISEGVKYIGPKAFVDCTNLLSLWLPASLSYIDEGNSVFEGCKNLTISVASESQHFFTEDDVLYWYRYYDKKLVLSWIPEKKSGEYTIKNKTDIIGYQAIRYISLSKLTIPASVMDIMAYNFSYAYNLKTVELNWNVEELGKLKYNPKIATFYFDALVYSDITLLVPKGTKAAYEAHELWGMGFKIVEK